MGRTKHELTWTVGHSDSPVTRPPVAVPASVPGAVQLDWARAEGLPDYAYGQNYLAYEWMEGRYWHYSAVLPELPELGAGQRLYLTGRGIDYQFLIRLDGKELHRQEGMFTPFELELTQASAAGGALEIVVFPVPKREGAAKDRSQASQSCKPAVSYGWDWHPRLIPLGIWDELCLEVREAAHIRRAETFARLLPGAAESAAAHVRLEALLTGTADKLLWRLYDPAGRPVAEREASLGREAADAVVRLDIALDEPELWWPNGHGEPNLYTSETLLLDSRGAVLDTATSRLGIRSIRLVMHEGAWDEPSAFPKSRSHPPITLEVNGRRLFAKGTNWVNPDIFPGRLNRERYAELLKLAHGAHMNLIRVWGGGIVNKSSFFDLCDELGLMVWQEFPLACNDYEGTPAYLDILDRESRSIILALRSRASLAIWCGGNELFNAWSGMTDQSLALRLLNRNCYDLDPHTPFLATSPLDGMGHGHYLFRDPDSGEEVYQWMPRASCTAYTEFGVPSPAHERLLTRFIPPEELYPPAPGGAWEAHHAYGAWQGDTWLCRETIEFYFGPTGTLGELVERGQLLQSEGYRCIYEEARRQQPKCAMALNWCFNEAWPTAAGNSLVCWPAEPKPALYAVGQACRPVLASARIPKFAWTSGEWFEPQLWLLSDAPFAVAAGQLTATLLVGERSYRLLAWEYPELPPAANAPGPTVRFRLPEASADGRMTLRLEAESHPEWTSSYTLLLRPAADAPRFQRTLNH